MAMIVATMESSSERNGTPMKTRRRWRSEVADSVTPRTSGAAMIAASQTRIRMG